ncbi:hypothetical protein DFP72DRAFT_1089696 [Ephemerocybe angulata]|uniref:DUF6729 domain-containing protein n=1 Tax=Ephemerocybe angulata TaxID=980116 RepID=A0A8H6I8Y5_9AGAR|nr:hypothetical protein DFP72DRAFT_1089696 [Tulosesus angulatus]
MPLPDLDDLKTLTPHSGSHNPSGPPPSPNRANWPNRATSPCHHDLDSYLFQLALVTGSTSRFQEMSHQSSPATLLNQDSSESSTSSLPTSTVKPAKRGRPKGSKDKPRASDAPPRGRPRKQTAAALGTNTVNREDDGSGAEDEFDALFDNAAFTHEAMNEIQEIENAFYATQESRPPPACPNLGACPRAAPSGRATATDTRAKHGRRVNLDAAVNSTNTRPFFTSASIYDDMDSGSDTEGDSDGETDSSTAPGKAAPRESVKGNRYWFTPPKGMPAWLIDYFVDVIGPAFITAPREGRSVKTPPCFKESNAIVPPTLWVNAPDPVFALSQHRFDPSMLFRPRVFLWLPHFFVKAIICPNCNKQLEKNGALCPRRVYDVEDSFYIVSWAYYCRSGCRSHFHGWNSKLISTLMCGYGAKSQTRL